MKHYLNTILGLVMVVFVTSLLAMSDSKLFDDPELSPLYESTLEKAYSRFRDTDIQVRIGQGGSSKLLEMAEGFEQADENAGTGAPKPHDHNGPPFVNGARLVSEGKYREALVEYRKALLEDPNCGVAKHEIGDILVKLGEWDQALKEYQDALRAHPGKACIYEHMGDIYTQKKQESMADQMYDKYVQTLKRGQGSPEQNNANQYAIVQFYLKKGKRLNEAAKLAEQLVARQKDRPEFIQLLATCYQQVGRQDEANTLLKKLQTLPPPAPVEDPSGH